MTGNGEYAIQTIGLRKAYNTRGGRKVAVDGLDMKVPMGGVHGFLGPNGSGKTTTIRMLLGLIHAEAGQMYLLGNPVPEQLEETINQVGAIVESPKFYGGYSGRLNLELCASAIRVPKARVDQVLEEVGLAERGADRFNTYSLGMKQRLAVAATLLKDPQLLIFDEPTNGLDPAGIHEIRESIKTLGASGRTVLVSSHILSEVEQMADTVTIIARGKKLAEGPVAQITGQGSNTVFVEVANLPASLDVLRTAGFRAQLADGQIAVSDAPDRAAITRTLAEHGHYVTQLISGTESLEEIFLQLTEGVGVGEMGIDVQKGALR
jgi:ABC-2 type transport system ATP-binding protein